MDPGAAPAEPVSPSPDAAPVAPVERPAARALSFRDGELRLVRWIFLRGLAAIYGLAFLSLWVQIDGLLGSRGIMPVARLMEAVRGEGNAGVGFWSFPTIFWLGSSDAFLHAVCGAGVALSIVAFLNLAPVAAFAWLWFLYLSILHVGGDFLSFQWDILLLETGFLAIVIAPWRLRSRLRDEPEPSPLAIWLVRLLAFRLLFSSGVVKLTWDDRTWWDLTALVHHYQTQPLPTWTSWYAHQLPEWLQRASCAIMYLIEIPLPFFIFLPRRFRQIAFVGEALLQALIVLTGNYNFFNGLTILLALSALDDGALRAALDIARRLVRRPATEPTPPIPRRRESRGKLIFTALVGSVLLLLSVPPFVHIWRQPLPLPEPARRVLAVLAPFHLVNGYGLFRSMTTERDEIVIEGSEDGKEWKAYEFHWKPGDPLRRPAFVEPHQPRLDWQMWFAALSRIDREHWFQSFLKRLLEGSPPVLGLLETNPFPLKPPRLVRALLYRYTFTDPAERRATGAWWRRELLRPYCPAISLASFR